MSSSVFFKFKSQKEPSRVTFDGTGISVFELKREIITINRLGDGNDFDLAIFNEDTNEEYDDDTTIIARSTSIVAKRLPPARAGKGSAARYVTGKMPVSAKNSSRTERSNQKDSVSKPTTSVIAGPTVIDSSQTEEERIAAMLNADAEQWDQQKKEMANATPVYRPNAGRGKGVATNAPSNPPPSGYVCYRCGEKGMKGKPKTVCPHKANYDKGHWIQQCPTNDDPNFDGRPRVKRTTGIPRSFLRTVAKPDSLSKDSSGDGTSAPSGVMVNAEGEFVVAEPDNASWALFQAKAKASEQAQQIAAKGNKELQDLGLECPIDKKLFVAPTKTPCCNKTYCTECITNALFESDLTCPNCHTEGVILEELVVDEEMVATVKAYVKKQEQQKGETKSANASKEGSPVKSDSPVSKQAKVPNGIENNAKSPSSDTAGLNTNLQVPQVNGLSGIESPNRASTSTPGASSATSNGSKKRAADMELENDRIPKAPAAMRQQQARMNQHSQGQNNPTVNGNPQNFSFGMPGMPNAFANNGMFPNGAGIMASMGPMMPMATGMMNPMMMMNGGYGGFNPMAFPQAGNMGFNNMMGANGFNSMAMPNMGLPNMNMGAMPGMNMNGNGGMTQQNGAGQVMGGGQMPAMAFPNQQRSGPGDGSNEEDNAYFRQPVNPHRHQGRQRRTRPSDYREL
ncbi:MAG: hypothetical protein M1814_004584 [Vezdaea aestivalis]|nr:MAG: hypothetical protein M1814_004584 [Vezdaea aestivalis]